MIFPLICDSIDLRIMEIMAEEPAALIAWRAIGTLGYLLFAMPSQFHWTFALLNRFAESRGSPAADLAFSLLLAILVNLMFGIALLSRLATDPAGALHCVHLLWAFVAWGIWRPQLAKNSVPKATPEAKTNPMTIGVHDALAG